MGNEVEEDQPPDLPCCIGCDRQTGFYSKCDGTTLDIVQYHSGSHMVTRIRRGRRGSRETHWEVAAVAQAGDKSSSSSMEEVEDDQVHNLFRW